MLGELIEQLAFVKASTREYTNVSKTTKVRQLEKEVSQFKAASEEEARHMKAEDDARLLEFQLYCTTVLEDEAAATTNRKGDTTSSQVKEVMPRQPRQRSWCVICLQAKAVVTLMPCGHLCVCEAPACMLQSCPICRAPVVQAKRMYGLDKPSQAQRWQQVQYPKENVKTSFAQIKPEHVKIILCECLRLLTIVCC